MLQQIADASVMAGRPENYPPALKNRPILSQFEQPFYKAFHSLSSSRQWTMGGPAPIPMSEVVAYLEAYGITDLDEREEYMNVIRKVDAAYLESYFAKQPKPKG